MGLRPFDLRQGLNDNSRRIAQGTFKGEFAVPQFSSMRLKDGGEVKSLKPEVLPPGPIQGPGTAKSDSIPTKLKVHDFILPAEVVQAIGPDKLQAMVSQFEQEGPQEDSMENGEEIPAQVSNGEFRVPANVVEQTGPEYWDKLVMQVTGHPAQPEISQEGVKAYDGYGPKSLKNGFPDYGYGDRYQAPNDPNPARPKAQGFYGEVKRPDGGLSTELSVDTGRGEIPSLVPGLSKREFDAVLSAKDGQPFPDSVYQKADSYAAFRQLNGKTPFAGVNDKQELTPVENDGIVSNALKAPNDPKYQYAQGGFVVKAQNGYSPDSLSGQRQASQDFWNQQSRSVAPTPGRANPVNPSEVMQARLANSANNTATQAQGLRSQINQNVSLKPAPQLPTLPSNVTSSPMNQPQPIKGNMDGMSSEMGISSGLAYDVLTAPEIAKGRDEAIATLKAKGGFSPTATPFKYAEGGLVQKFAGAGYAKGEDELKKYQADLAQRRPDLITQGPMQPKPTTFQNVQQSLKNSPIAPTVNAYGDAVLDVTRQAKQVPQRFVEGGPDYNALRGQGYGVVPATLKTASNQISSVANPAIDVTGSALKKGFNTLFAVPEAQAQDNTKQPNIPSNTQQSQKASVAKPEQDNATIQQPPKPSLATEVAQPDATRNITGKPVGSLDDQGFYTVTGKGGGILDKDGNVIANNGVPGKTYSGQVLDWNTTQNSLQNTMGADDYNRLQAQAQDYRNQRNNAVIGQSSSYEQGPKGTYSLRSETGGFTPNTGLSLGKSADNSVELLKLAAEQNRNKYNAIRDPDTGEVSMVPESGPIADKAYAQRQNNKAQLAYNILNDPNAINAYPEEHRGQLLAAAKQFFQTEDYKNWLKSQR